MPNNSANFISMSCKVLRQIQKRLKRNKVITIMMKKILNKNKFRMIWSSKLIMIKKEILSKFVGCNSGFLCVLRIMFSRILISI